MAIQAWQLLLPWLTCRQRMLLVLRQPKASIARNFFLAFAWRPQISLLKSSTLLTGHAESAEMTWRSLYACRNGWRRLRPGCIDALELPSVACMGFETRYPTCCVLDGRDLGWTAAAGDASELLVVDAPEGVQVELPLAPCASALPTGVHLADKRVHAAR